MLEKRDTSAAEMGGSAASLRLQYDPLGVTRPKRLVWNRGITLGINAR